MTDLRAHGTPVTHAEGGVDADFITLSAYCLASDPEAVKALVALRQVNRHGLAFPPDVQRAGSPDDDHRRLIGLHAALDGVFDEGQVKGVDDVDVPDADAPHQVLYDHSRHLVSSGRCAGARMPLVPGHGRGAVVQNDSGPAALVVDRVHQAGDTRMHESGIADDADYPVGY